MNGPKKEVLSGIYLGELFSRLHLSTINLVKLLAHVSLIHY